MGAPEERLFDKVEARTKLAGNNKLELLLFTLGEDERTGRTEHFGINVFKVTEVIHRPPITAAPGSPNGMLGMVSLRGNITPVVDLAGAMGSRVKSSNNIMIVTEFNRRKQAFVVDSVDKIVRLNWSNIKEQPAMLSGEKGAITSNTELPDGRLVQIIDVERILADIIGVDEGGFQPPEEDDSFKNSLVFFADDSVIAQKQIETNLKRIGVRLDSAHNGAAAWEKLDSMARFASANGKRLCDDLNLIITDLEMPEMDGYTLVAKIKADNRFDGVKVLTHSSISGAASASRSQSVKADGHLPKFDAEEFARTVKQFLAA